MAIDYKVLAVNGGDTAITAAFASTAATAAARAAQAVSALSAEITTFLTGAVAIVPEAITAAQKKAVAVTLLLSAGVTLDGAGTAALLADPLVREQIRLGNSRNNGEKLTRAVF